MKKALLILSIVCFVGLTKTSFGQKSSIVSDLSVKASKVTFKGEPNIECKQAIYNEESHLYTFIDSVSLTTGKLKFLYASKAVYDVNTKKLIVYGCDTFGIEGDVVRKAERAKENIIVYTIGDDTAYVL